MRLADVQILQVTDRFRLPRVGVREEVHYPDEFTLRFGDQPLDGVFVVEEPCPKVSGRFGIWLLLIEVQVLLP